MGSKDEGARVPMPTEEWPVEDVVGGEADIRRTEQHLPGAGHLGPDAVQGAAGV